MKEDTAGDRKS